MFKSAEGGTNLLGDMDRGGQNTPRDMYPGPYPRGCKSAVTQAQFNRLIYAKFELSR